MIEKDNSLRVKKKKIRLLLNFIINEGSENFWGNWRD